MYTCAPDEPHRHILSSPHFLWALTNIKYTWVVLYFNWSHQQKSANVYVHFYVYYSNWYLYSRWIWWERYLCLTLPSEMKLVKRYQMSLRYGRGFMGIELWMGWVCKMRLRIIEFIGMSHSRKWKFQFHRIRTIPLPLLCPLIRNGLWDTWNFQFTFILREILEKDISIIGM